MTRALNLGGTETQFVQLLRGLRAFFEVHVAVLHDEGPLREEAKRLAHSYALHPRGTPFLHPQTAGQVRRIARWLTHQRVDVVHVHDFAATCVVVPAAKLAGCKLVVSRLDLAPFQSLRQRALWSLLTRCADRVIANADAISEMLIRDERLAPSRITVIHNGIDLAQLDAQRRSGLTSPLPRPLRGRR